MLPLSFLEYELKEKPKEVITRLKWAVEQVDMSWLTQMFTKTIPATHKHWIGEIDEHKHTFNLEQAGSYFKRKFNIVLKGSIEQQGATTQIKIRLGIDNFAAVLITFLYLVIILITVEAISNGIDDNFLYSAFYFLIYPTVWTFLIKHRMKIAERNLDLIFSEGQQ